MASLVVTAGWVLLSVLLEEESCGWGASWSQPGHGPNCETRVLGPGSGWPRPSRGTDRTVSPGS